MKSYFRTTQGLPSLDPAAGQQPDKDSSGHTKEVCWYVRIPNDQFIKRTNTTPGYLQAARLDPQRLHMSADINQPVQEADVLIFAYHPPILLQK